MRRYTLILVLALIAVALIVSGCGNKASSSGGSSDAAAVSLSGQEIFDKTMAAAPGIKSMTGTMDMTLNVDMGPSASADPSAAMFSQGPITVSGDIAGSQDPAQAEGILNLSLAGQAIQFGAKVIDKQMWVNYMGTWYETPPSTTKALSDPQAQGATTDPLGALKKMGVDPSTWASEMTVVGVEQVAGVDTYHVKITVDSVKMITDLIKLSQSPEVSKALGDQATNLAVPSPSASDVAAIEQMFKSATLDIWSQTDTFYPRKMAIAAEIVPPADQAAGVNSLTLSMGLTYDTINEPVTVEVPTDAKPAKELEKALQQLAPLLGGLGGSI